MGRPKSAIKMQSISLRVPEKDIAELNRYSKTEKQPMSVLCRLAIKNLLSKLELQNQESTKLDSADIENDSSKVYKKAIIRLEIEDINKLVKYWSIKKDLLARLRVLIKNFVLEIEREIEAEQKQEQINEKAIRDHKAQDKIKKHIENVLSGVRILDENGNWL